MAATAQSAIAVIGILGRYPLHDRSSTKSGSRFAI